MSNESFIPWAKPDFWGNEKIYLNQALESTWISGGSFVDRFEKDFAHYCGAHYALTASNGTTALHMAYLALDLGPGDEVILPGFGFMGAANMVLYVGAKPIFAEVDPKTWCLSATEVEKNLSQHTKLIVPIHTYGNVCEMDAIMQLANEHNIAVVEDTAEAFASRFGDQIAGSFSPIGTFSFQATKTITTGEGGMVITNDESLYDRMSLYRSHGMRRKQYYWHDLAGHNFRLTNLQAALGVAQMEKLELIIRRRKHIHRQYQDLLSDVPGLTLQYYPPEVDAVLWAVALKLDPLAYPQGRDIVIQEMKEAQIETRPGFVAPRFMEHIYNCPELPITEELSRQVLSLPTYPTLQDEQIEYICKKLKDLKK
jgi:perosamine synthetase